VSRGMSSHLYICRSRSIVKNTSIKNQTIVLLSILRVMVNVASSTSNSSSS
jgi:hypothetical protein